MTSPDIDRPQGRDEHPSSLADELFAAHLVRCPSSDEDDFVEVCEAHPQEADELREIREGWLRVVGVLFTPASRDVVLPEILRGKEESGPPHLATESTESEFTSEVMERLAKRAGSFRRYRHVTDVARGAQGIVTHVWEEDLRRHLAMKRLLREELAQEPTADADPSPKPTRKLSRFLEEAQVTGQLGHPGVLPVHELGLDDHGWPFFTMPLVRGQTLAEVFEAHHSGHQRWSFSRLLGVLLKVCDAVGYAHSKGVIHRDLKPSNVMIGEYGETYVMDWGLAHVVGRAHQPDVRLRDLPLDPAEWIESDRERARQGSSGSPLFTMDGDVIGTPAYMSPEQARGNLVELGERADVYAIGALLYHFLSGAPPYALPAAQNTAREVVAQLLLGPPAPLPERAPEAPPELVAICEKAMAYELDRRYAGVSELADDLHAYLDHRPVLAHDPGLWHTLKLSLVRNRRLAGAISIAAGVLLVSSLVFVLRLSASEARSRRRADLNAGPALLEREGQLFPAVPAMAEPMRRWLASSAALVARRPLYEAELAGLAAHDDLERLALAGLLDQMERIEARRAPVTERLEFAGRLERISLIEPAAEWDAAIAAIAASPVYGGLRLEPQLGLVPLGENSHSGLWEFWHVASGERPQLDPERADDGAWDMRETSGQVLILVPGGTFTMGSPLDERGRYPVQERPHEVTLEPYFLSRYELTQGQYLRVFDVNPSRRQPASPSVPPVLDERHPVESLEWADALEAAVRLDLVLPSEAQWERAARATTDTPYYWGNDPRGARVYENLADQTLRYWVPSLNAWSPWEDGWAFHAPVGLFRPSPWGFHDLQGNVSEWCADEYRQELVDEQGRPLPADDTPHRVWSRSRRGMHLEELPEEARTARRHSDSPRGGNLTHGVRLGREVR